MGEDYIRARPVLSFNFRKLKTATRSCPCGEGAAAAAPLKSQSPARTGSCHGNGRRGAPPCHRAQVSECQARVGLAMGFSSKQSLHRPRDRIRRRHHLHESVIQRAMKDAVRKAGVAKPARLHDRRVAVLSGRNTDISSVCPRHLRKNSAADLWLT